MIWSLPDLECARGREESGTVGFEKCFCSCVHGRIWNVVQYSSAASNWLYGKWFGLWISSWEANTMWPTHLHKLNAIIPSNVHFVLHRTAALSAALSLDPKSLSGSHFYASVSIATWINMFRAKDCTVANCWSMEQPANRTIPVFQNISAAYSRSILSLLVLNILNSPECFRAFPGAFASHFSRMASYCLEVSPSPCIFLRWIWSTRLVRHNPHRSSKTAPPSLPDLNRFEKKTLCCRFHMVSPDEPSV